MNKMLKISAVLTALCLSSASAFAVSAEQAVRAVQGRASQLTQSVGSLQTLWERCDVKQYRNRARLRGMGKGHSRRITLTTNCENVQTRCGAVVKDALAFVPADCFYASKKDDQKLTLQTARLTWNGKNISVQKNFSGAVGEFVYFTLP